MFSDNSLTLISRMFSGDIGEFYCYKGGPKLVAFFNSNFNYKDIYGAGFPSRWQYVYDKIVEIYDKGKIDSFFSLILSKRFIISEFRCNDVEALTKIHLIHNEINNILRTDGLHLTFNKGTYTLIKTDEDLELIGSGGFAKVYFQKSTQKIIKKLKDDFVMDEGIRSRFKREFTITKSIQDIDNVIRVYDFDDDTYSYSMEKAEQTLENFICNNKLDDLTKISYIRQILCVMSEVHSRDIIHRDISPNNIFILDGNLKIADFGLGKDLNVFASHQTNVTNAFGQYFYCAPEQFMLLKDGEKRSDVFSIGRLINFIMTGDSINTQHMFKSVVEKASSSNIAFRYLDASELSNFLEKAIEFNSNNVKLDKILDEISHEILSADVQMYISHLSGEKICQLLIKKQDGFLETVIQYMELEKQFALDIIQQIEDNFRKCSKRFEDADPFATLAYKILISPSFEFLVKELAAQILKYVAKDVNRFSAQKLVTKAIECGIEPLLEEKLSS